MTQHPTYHWNGTTYSTLLCAAATGGHLSIVYGDSGPDLGPPRHIHDAEDEIFIVLEGSMTFEVAGKLTVCGPLDVAVVPRGTAHCFVTGTQGARGLTIFTPGGFEGFFAAMAKANFSMPQDLAKMTATAARFRSRIVGPGLATGH